MTYSIQRPSNSETSPRNSSNEFCHFRASKIPQIAKTIQRAALIKQRSGSGRVPELMEKSRIVAPSARSPDEYLCVWPGPSVMVLVLLNWLALVQD